MEVHKPKPWHGWREFLKEYGIIVLGVLTALAFEQAVEALHWRYEVRDAEDAMNAELQKNALEAYRKLTTFACAENQLDGIGAALVSARDTGAAVPTMAPYQRPLTPFSDDAWRAATAAGVANHIPKDRLLAYSRAYFFADDQRERIMPWEQDAMDRLNTLTINAGRLQPEERDRLFASIVFARRVLLQGSLSAANYLEDARELGVNISPKEKAEAQATERSYMGRCVGDAMTRGQILAMYRRDWGRGTLSAPLK